MWIEINTLATIHESIQFNVYQDVIYMHAIVEPHCDIWTRINEW